MPFISASEQSGRQFNNADSFAMAFDEAWRSRPSLSSGDQDERDQRLEEILSSLTEHPFVQASPELARDVALFRMRLLDF
ncbi:hypothetical protein [Synechococcus sp. RSCCF101]|uniref:hypothetical protein n=1 Tax=Synechococcus sp. RSCCF101 TaxID=2511069 RepID=UPI0012486D9C|nr:hypothetical protein [Synechococcus sp. RSCCF101]